MPANIVHELSAWSEHGEKFALYVNCSVLETDQDLPAADPFTVEATRDEAGHVQRAIPWTAHGPDAVLDLEVGVADGSDESAHALRLDATVRVPGAPPARSRRDLRVAEGTSGLFDVVSEGERRLVLSLRVETISRTVLPGPKKVGAAVLFALSVERRDGERSVLLETNRLVTFLREGVEYSFARGDGDARESLRLVLTPVRLEGDVVEIDVDVTGTLPAAPGPLLLMRRDRPRLPSLPGITSGTTNTASCNFSRTWSPTTSISCAASWKTTRNTGSCQTASTCERPARS